MGFLGWLLAGDIDHDAFREQLIAHEGWRNKLYSIEGVPHIGVGFNLTFPISDEAIEAELGVRMHAAIQACARLDYWRRLSARRKLAVADLVYTMGPTDWRREFPRANAALRARDYRKAARELEFIDPDVEIPVPTKWYQQVGPRRARKIIEMIEAG